ncbi:hypothetical protein D3C79_764600 [compost metagenome]
MFAQTPQRSAGGRLAKVKALRRPADAALLEQHIQGDQQVEIKTSIAHGQLIPDRGALTMRFSHYQVSPCAIHRAASQQ